MAEWAETLSFSASSTAANISTFGFQATQVRLMNRGAALVYFRTDGTAASTSNGAMLLSSGEVLLVESGRAKDNVLGPISVGFTTTATSTSALQSVNVWASN